MNTFELKQRALVLAKLLGWRNIEGSRGYPPGGRGTDKMALIPEWHHDSEDAFDLMLTEQITVRRVRNSAIDFYRAQGMHGEIAEVLLRDFKGNNMLAARAAIVECAIKKYERQSEQVAA